VDSLIPARDELAYLESIIERGRQTFIEVGTALMEIREKGLHKTDGWDTFEDYCRERWGFSRFYAHRLIEAAEVANDVLPTGNVPKSERQARELARLPDPESRREVWQQVVADHGANVTAAKVREAIRFRFPEPIVADLGNDLPPPPVEPPEERTYRLLREQMIHAMRMPVERIVALEWGDDELLTRFRAWLNDLISAVEGAQKVRRIK
jgi:hypothetical protein